MVVKESRGGHYYSVRGSFGYGMVVGGNGMFEQ